MKTGKMPVPPYFKEQVANLLLQGSNSDGRSPPYNSISVIDAPTMKILTTIKVGHTVRGIAVNSQTNRVYVTLVNEENKVIVIQDR